MDWVPAYRRLMANVFEYVPLFKPITRDNYRSLQVDSVCNETFPAIFGITPRAIEELVPAYLGHQRARARYQSLRQHAQR